MAINEVTFNSVNFWQDLGAALSAPISYPVPTEVKELVKIKGANGSLTEATGYYNNIEIDAKFKVLIGRGEENYDTFEKLKKGINQIFNNVRESKLSFKEIPNKYYKVKTAGIGPVTKISEYEATFEVTFNCDPFLYSTEDTPISKNSSSVTVDYNGDIPNAPKITLVMAQGGQTHLSITGGGTLSFETNPNETYYINRSPYSLVIDSEGKAIKSTGPTPVLSTGKGISISVTGLTGATAKTITVYKDERYLG